MKKLYFPACFFIITCLFTSCYHMRASRGGGQISSVPSRKIVASDIALPPQYKIEAISSELNFPSGITFDDEGHIYVIEAGYSYGEV